MSTPEEDRLQYLVEQTFRTDAGQQLLDEWYQTYCTGLFNENALQMARKVGRADFINDVLSLLNTRSE